MTTIDCKSIAIGHVTESEQIRVADRNLAKEGYVILSGVLPPQTVQELNEQFNNSYARYLQDRDGDDVLKVGNRRYMVPVRISGRFRDPLVYANPFVLAVVREALGSDAILESFGAVVSLSGSEAQHVHRDSPLLFDAGISSLLPAHALTVVMPLIDMDECHGTTAVWAGSHRWKSFDDGIAPETPHIPIGSCAIWDFRLFHGGTPNCSDINRPILYLTYARRWYHDPNNFLKEGQRRICLDKDFIYGLPEDHEKLFAHIRCTQKV